MYDQEKRKCGYCKKVFYVRGYKLQNAKILSCLYCQKRFNVDKKEIGVKMGMFDIVDCVMECPHCGTKLDNFQTKDGCNTLATLKIKDLEEDTRFYDTCNKCKLKIICIKG